MQQAIELIIRSDSRPAAGRHQLASRLTPKSTLSARLPGSGMRLTGRLDR
jgi:hypothetical protein